jgi:ABC-2 type transport system permease protein
MSLGRLLIGTIPVTFLALLLFAFNIYALGLPLIAFFINLVLTGWAFGLAISGIIMRHGLGAESLAYSIMILLLPLCCVYYPIWVLPAWLQPIAWSLAPTYVFEGMRAVLLDHIFRADLMIECLALNVVYLVVGFAMFILLLRSARRSGTLITLGE